MIDFITDEDLQQDLNIGVRLHRVKIIEGIKKLKLKTTSGDEGSNQQDGGQARQVNAR